MNYRNEKKQYYYPINFEILYDHFDWMLQDSLPFLIIKEVETEILSVWHFNPFKWYWYVVSYCYMSLKFKFEFQIPKTQIKIWDTDKITKRKREDENKKESLNKFKKKLYGKWVSYTVLWWVSYIVLWFGHWFLPCCHRMQIVFHCSSSSYLLRVCLWSYAFEIRITQNKLVLVPIKKIDIYFFNNFYFN